VVSPEDDLELRRTRIANRRACAPHRSHQLYRSGDGAAAGRRPTRPSQKLFVQTEILPERGAILCTRRPRDKEEPTPWLLNLMTVHRDGEQRTGAGIRDQPRRLRRRGGSNALPQALAAANHAPLGAARVGARSGDGDPPRVTLEPARK
jgi:cyclic beta-1,2-glucan synthetase